MTRYRDTTTGEIWTEDELTTCLAKQIEGLGDENFLKQDVDLRGDAAIRDYIIECKHKQETISGLAQRWRTAFAV